MACWDDERQPVSLTELLGRVDDGLRVDGEAGEGSRCAIAAVVAALPWLRMVAAREELADGPGRPCGSSATHVMHTWYGAAEVDGAVTMRMHVCKGTPVRVIAVGDARHLQTLRCYGGPGTGCRAVLVFAAEIDWALVGALGWTSVERRGQLPEVRRTVGWDPGLRAAYAGAGAVERVWLCPEHR